MVGDQVDGEDDDDEGDDGEGDDDEGDDDEGGNEEDDASAERILDLLRSNYISPQYARARRLTRRSSRCQNRSIDQRSTPRPNAQPRVDQCLVPRRYRKRRRVSSVATAETQTEDAQGPKPLPQGPERGRHQVDAVRSLWCE